jgi:hypothetical protein
MQSPWAPPNHSPPCLMTRQTSNQHQRRRAPPPTGNTVFQLNVNRGMRGGAVHDAALQLAWANKSDIVLLQEPWTSIPRDRCVTKTHAGYDLFLSSTL